MQKINAGILSNASPLTAEQIKALEQRALENSDIFVYLNEDSEICFAGNLKPTLIKDLAWHNTYELSMENNTITKTTYAKQTYNPTALFKKYTMDSAWGQITVIDDATTKLPSMAFIGQDALKMVIIPDSVQEIGSSAFSDCINLTEVVIGAGVRKIGSNAFTGCSALNKVYFKGTETVWNLSVTIDSPSGGYFDNAIKYFYSEVRPTAVGKFWHFVNSVPVDWAEYVPPRYSEGLFWTDNQDGTCKLMSLGECMDTEIIIPPTNEEYGQVTAISNQAFYSGNSRNIVSITIPDSVTNIGMFAFMGCSSLDNLIYEGTVAQWSAIDKHRDWSYGIPTGLCVQCSDGQVAI